ncbi:MAG: cyanophycinase [Acetobacteraceae bacterium]|nr:cyanophycinase [Acetobacteraceae bacterium]
MGEKVRGRLVIIGGREDTRRDCVILRTFLGMAGGPRSRILVLTAASGSPQSSGEDYRRIFTALGAGAVDVLHLPGREAASRPESLDMLARASAVFFTGGDQLRLTSTLGGTELDKLLHRRYAEGLLVAGTSAGASAMSDTMIVAGKDEDPPKKCTTKMAPGLGLLEEVVIDQHFAERGRLGRLLSAVAQNPFVLGVGIDEDTALVVTPDARFLVVGSQTVTVLDGGGISLTNASEQSPDEPLALADVRLHVLPAGYGFDLKRRRPLRRAGGGLAGG